MVKCEDQGYFKAEDLIMEDTENSPHLSNYIFFFLNLLSDGFIILSGCFGCSRDARLPGSP